MWIRRAQGRKFRKTGRLSQINGIRRQLPSDAPTESIPNSALNKDGENRMAGMTGVIAAKNVIADCRMAIRFLSSRFRTNNRSGSIVWKAVCVKRGIRTPATLHDLLIREASYLRDDPKLETIRIFQVISQIICILLIF